MINIISQLSTFNGHYPKPDSIYEKDGKMIESWSGKCILSYILPEHINLEMKNGSYDNISPDDSNPLKN